MQIRCAVRRFYWFAWEDDGLDAPSRQGPARAVEKKERDKKRKGRRKASEISFRGERKLVYDKRLNFSAMRARLRRFEVGSSLRVHLMLAMKP